MVRKIFIFPVTSAYVGNTFGLDISLLALMTLLYIDDKGGVTCDIG